jgi:HK97 family phage major capsid protein
MDKKIITLRASLSDKQSRLSELEAVLNVEEGAANYRSLTETENGEIGTLTAECKNLRSQISLLENAASELTATRGVLVATGGNPVNTGLGETQKKDVGQFSVLRAIRTAAAGKEQTGIEAEMHQEAMNELRSCRVDQVPTLQGSFMLPSLITRALTATGQTSVAGDQGGVNVATSIMGNVPSLDSELVLTKLGAEFMTDLVGNYDFTVENDNFRPDWLAENGSAQNKNLTYGKKTLSPKRLSGYVKESSQLLVQTSASIERRIREKIYGGTAIALESAALYGSGSSNQPLGLINDSGITVVAGGTNGLAITRDHLIALMNAPGAANYQGRSYGFATNFSVRSKLMRTLLDAGSGKFLWEANEQNLFGYNTAVSTIVPNNLVKGTSGAVCSAVAFGDFSQLKMAQWGGINIIVDALTERTDGYIKLIVETFADALVLQPKAFGVMKDALTV